MTRGGEIVAPPSGAEVLPEDFAGELLGGFSFLRGGLAHASATEPLPTSLLAERPGIGGQ